MSGEDRDLLAGEYVAGLMSPEAEQAFARRLTRDKALAALVEDWRARLAPLDDTAAAEPAPPALWDRIAASAAAAPAPARAAPRRAPWRFRSGWWESLAFWRGAGLAAASAAALLLVALGVQTWRAERTPTMVAVLLSDAARPVAVVNTFEDGRVELVPLAAIEVPQGRALEIWTMWDKALGPKSIGVIPRAETTPLRLDRVPLAPDQFFAISIEPAGGSPTGAPTGPVVAQGVTNTAL